MVVIVKRPVDAAIDEVKFAIIEHGYVLHVARHPMHDLPGFLAELHMLYMAWAGVIYTFGVQRSNGNFRDQSSHRFPLACCMAFLAYTFLFSSSWLCGAPKNARKT